MSSIFGNIFKVSTWGESHGAGVGVVVDGCPAGLGLCEEDIQRMLDRRKPGSSAFTTQRSEADKIEILSGVFGGLTTGTPISLLVRNKDHHSSDYQNLAEQYRPGHADYCFDRKYGFRDWRGGGRSSGRETIGRVASGAIAEKLLSLFGICFLTYVDRIGDIEISADAFDEAEINRNPLCMPDRVAADAASDYLKRLMQEGDSSGSRVVCRVSGLPAGLGEPVFGKLDALLGQAVFSIGAVKGLEIGDGFAVSSMRGSDNNDGFFMENGEVKKLTNHSGGVLGGISDGSELILRAAFKPTPSIFREQKTVDRDGNNVTMNIAGRHDPVIGPRAAVVVESMTALVLADLLLENAVCRVSNLQKIYD